MSKKYEYKRPKDYPELSDYMAVNENGELTDIEHPDIEILGIMGIASGSFYGQVTIHWTFWYNVQEDEN